MGDSLNNEDIKSQKVPKNVFVLWDPPEGKWPAVVKISIELWKKLNPTWNVNIFSRDELEECLYQFLPGRVLRNMPIQLKADIFRLKLLKDQGGIWADATCLPIAPLGKWFHLVEDDDFAAPGFEMLKDKGISPDNGKAYGNWFLISKQNGYVVSKLLDRMIEFHDEPKFHIPRDGDLARHVEKNWRVFAGEHGKAAHFSPYFLMHYLTTLEFERDEKFREILIQNHIPRGVYNYVMSRMARYDRDENALPEVLNFVHRAPVPCNKLDWRLAPDAPWDQIYNEIYRKTSEFKVAQKITAAAKKSEDSENAPVQFKTESKKTSK